LAARASRHRLGARAERAAPDRRGDGTGRRRAALAIALAATVVGAGAVAALIAHERTSQRSRSVRPARAPAAPSAGRHPPVAEPPPASVAIADTPVPAVGPPPRARAARGANAAAPAMGAARAAPVARAAGDRARALDLYGRIARRFGGSPAAAVAEIAIGTLLLEAPGAPATAPSTGDAAAALAAFDRYLDSEPADAPLRDEALAGRARALEALGDVPAAGEAWRRLIAERPASPLAAGARRRLGAPAGGQPDGKAR
jgi:tetratricopeptide (TPR) repeat protein